jgi:membrane protein DedA with SNARE-associated domain
MHTSVIEQIIFLVIGFISQMGYLGVFILMTLESALIPIPSEAIMPFSGFLVAQGRFNLVAVVVVGAFGNLFGSWLAYWLGYTKGEKYIRKLVVKYGKFILLTEEEFDSSLKVFNKYGQWVAGISRMLPAIRTVISLPAGIAKLDFWKFSALTFFGSLIWSFILAYIGLILGKNWEAIRPYFRKFDIVIVIIAIILVGAYLYHKLLSPKLRAKKT